MSAPIASAADALFEEAGTFPPGKVSVAPQLSSCLRRIFSHIRVERPFIDDLDGWRSADAARDHEMNRCFVFALLVREAYFHVCARQELPGHAGFSRAHTAGPLTHAPTACDAVAADMTQGREDR